MGKSVLLMLAFVFSGCEPAQPADPRLEEMIRDVDAVLAILDWQGPN